MRIRLNAALSACPKYFDAIYIYQGMLLIHASREFSINVQFHYNDVIKSAMPSKITSLTIVCSSVYSGAYHRKHKSSASLTFVRGIPRWPMNRPHKGPVTRKMFPFDDIFILKQVYAKKFCFPIMNNRHIWGICVFHIFMSAYIAWEFPDYRHCSWQQADKLPHILTNQQNKLRIITGSIAWIHRCRFGFVQILITQVKTLWHEYMFGCPRATD